MSAVSSDDELVATLRAAGCVFAEEEARLLQAQARTPAELALMTERRVSGEPLEHILGWAEFAGLRVVVEPGLFVPRHRSELLVDLAAAARRPHPDRPLVLVDLCCGTGAIGAAVAARLGRTELHAVDVDPVAVRCARRNLGDRGRVYEGDLYAPLPARLRGRVDVLVASPPYVPSAAIRLMPPEAREHEPIVALDGGSDGLDVVRRIVAPASGWLRPGGCLVVEMGEEQASSVAAAAAGAGLEGQLRHDDELGATVVVATRRV